MKTNNQSTKSGKIIRISVRALVEFLLQSGDLDSRAGAGVDREAMLAGGRLHRRLQKAAGTAYKSEVPLSWDTDCEDFVIRVEGRADGIFTESRSLALSRAGMDDSELPGQLSFDLQPPGSGAIFPAEGAGGQGMPSFSGQTPAEEASSGSSYLAQFPGGAHGEDLPETVTFIDEIKGVYMDIDRLKEPIKIHLAQAMCYAAIYLMKERLPVIGVRMTYASLADEAGPARKGKPSEDGVRAFHVIYTAAEIRAFYEDLVGQYERWARRQIKWEAVRDASMAALSFPFPYREGQKSLVASVYRTIEDKRELFLMAPTGVGKTMSVVYPSVRALGRGLASRIFYLTARNQTIKVGWEAFSILRDRGLRLKAVAITAKEKICPYDKARCNPDDCRYARGHFDRINEAVFKALCERDFFDSEAISAIAKEALVCPFELSLDIASWADAILGDYNYAFDPNASLKRFFGEGVKGDYILLVDEAHNLLDRAREMYSAALIKEDVLAAKNLVKGRSKKAERALEKLNKELLVLRKAFAAAREETGKVPDYLSSKNEDPAKAGHETLALKDLAGVTEAAVRAAEELDVLFKEEKDPAFREMVLNFYFELRGFMARLGEAEDESIFYTAYNADGHFQLTLRCVNPARHLQRTADRGRAAVFFSATLLPVRYYKEHFSTREDNYAIYARSPFKDEQKRILIGRDVSTRYRSRGQGMYRKIARYIHDTAAAYRGNYMAFFPSFKFMTEVLRVYRAEFDEEGINYVAQSRYMGEMDREIFLENFYEDPGTTLVGFCVMGGIFAEGIDLTGSRLIGAVIVGCGLPQVSDDVEILREYYDAKDGSGFACAYLYPGMNKVLQSAGRVIRTASDRGVIVLLDDRFLTEERERLFPREWESWYVVSAEETAAVLRDFWDEAEGGMKMPTKSRPKSLF